MTVRPCIERGCPRFTSSGSRCHRHERARQRERNARPHRQAYRDPAYRAMPIGTRCRVCGSTEDLTRDHVVPLAKGGTNAAANIVTLCRPCNSSKGATS